jgi:hypothetical protein
MDKWDLTIEVFWQYFMSPDPEGAPRAKELIKWYVARNGATFRGDRQVWGRFMRSQPQIKAEEGRFYQELAKELCADKKEKKGTLKRDAHSVVLTTEAMKLTLHGCHRLGVEGSYEVAIKGGNFVVSFPDSTWTWYDKGDLHGNLATKLKSGVVVPDQWFKSVGDLVGGKEYPIEISWTVSRRIAIPRDKTVCGADCKNEEYGACDNRTYDGERCHWHR